MIKRVAFIIRSGWLLGVFGIVSAVGASSAVSTPFPKEEPDRAFAAWKIYDAAGRPWRQAQEDWTGARERVKTDAAWAQWLRDETTAVKAWSTRHRDRVAWRCGFFHDFVSPTNGARLQWTEQVPGEEVDFLTSSSGDRVAVTPRILGAWVYDFRLRHADMIRRAARLYRLTDDRQMAEWAASQLDFYAAHYLEWEENRNGARLYGQTLDVAVNLVNYADTVRLLREYATPERRDRWQRKFLEPQMDNLAQTGQSIHNIPTWHRCGVMCAALVTGDEARWREALEGKFGLRQQIAQGITSDYIWSEQSLGYNRYVLRALMTVFVAAGLHGRAAELATEMNVGENLMLGTTVLSYPNGRLPTPADHTGPAPLAVDPLALAEVVRVFPTGTGLAAASGLRNWDMLLDPPATPSASASLPASGSVNLASTRMAMLRSGAWQVFFHYGQLTRSHAQAEVLNYGAFFKTTEVTRDVGTVNYGSPLHRGYYTRGLCHNVPLVDGEGSEPPQAGEVIAYSADGASMEVAQPRYREGVRVTRRLAISGEALTDTVKVACAGTARRLGLALHVQGKVALPSVFTAVNDFAATRPEPFRAWREVRSAVFRDSAEFDVTFGECKLRVHLTAPGEFVLYHAISPDRPPATRESFYLELSAPATQAAFTTVFMPAAADVRP